MIFYYIIIFNALITHFLKRFEKVYMSSSKGKEQL